MALDKIKGMVLNCTDVYIYVMLTTIYIHYPAQTDEKVDLYILVCRTMRKR